MLKNQYVAFIIYSCCRKNLLLPGEKRPGRQEAPGKGRIHSGKMEKSKDGNARMQLYRQIIEGRFIARPNRFIAQVETAAGVEICHVKNTGRCRELLVPGARVYLAAERPGRKTRCDLVAVEKGARLINMDSQAPNRIAAEAMPRLLPGLTLLRPETAFGQSRLDFYAEAGERKLFIEVKGVTLEQEGLALFPDAPTERGIRHLRELEKCRASGYEALLLLVIQMKGIRAFAPNWETHPAFGEALLHAREAGVRLLAYDCLVTPSSMTLDEEIPVLLSYAAARQGVPVRDAAADGE